MTGIKLRPYLADDFHILQEIRNDPDIQTLLLTHHKHNSPEQVLEWIERKSKDENGLFFVIADCNDSALGFLQAKGIDKINGTCYAGIALHIDYQNKGIFQTAFSSFERYLRDFSGIRKIIVEVMKGNDPSFKSFTKSGFRLVGEMRSHYFHDGVYSDVLIMEKIIV